MTQAITTKYLAPTNTKGARIKATTASGISHTNHYDYGVNEETNHKLAAFDLVRKLKWGGQWAGASTETGYVFVSVHGMDWFEVPTEEA